MKGYFLKSLLSGVNYPQCCRFSPLVSRLNEKSPYRRDSVPWGDLTQVQMVGGLTPFRFIKEYLIA